MKTAARSRTPWFLVLVALSLTALFPAAAWADTAPPSDDAAATDPARVSEEEAAVASRGDVDAAVTIVRWLLPKGAADFLAGQFQVIAMMDPYGVTSQMPRGWAYAKWDYTTITAKYRYDAYRKRGPVLAPFNLDAAAQALIGTDATTADLGVSGHGGGHTFQFSYGLNGMIDWYLEIPFTFMDVGFHPDKGAKAFLKYYFEQREMEPMVGYKGQWLLGDINTGFSWNIYRNPWFSVALTPRVYLPTGHIPNPNHTFTFASGPELETGIGGWAFGFTQGYDIRLLPKGLIGWMDIIASSEFTFTYATPQRRRYPDNYLKQANLLVQAFGGVWYPEWDNPSEKDTFGYTPGMGLDWTAQLNISLAVIGLGIGYGISHSAEAELYDIHPGFEAMAKALQLTGTQTMHGLQLACSINLGLFMVGFQWQKVVDGYNAIVFSDYYQLTLKGFFPVGPFDEPKDVKPQGAHIWGN
jgi:hypothetical protein